MDNQTKPESRGSARISTSLLRYRARSESRSQRVSEQVFAHEFNDHRTPHVLHDVIASKAQSQSEVNVEPPEKIALEVENESESEIQHTSDHRTSYAPHDEIALESQNQSEVKVEPKLWQSVQDQINESLAAQRTSDHGTPHVPPDEIALEAQNQSAVKVEPKSWLPVRDQINKSSATMHTSDHSTPHVPPDEIALQDQNQSEVKSLAAKSTSDHKTPHVPLDEIALEAQNQFVKSPMNEKTAEWFMLITSVLLEAMSAVFDQLGYALMDMVIAFLALFLSGLYLICKARKEGVKRSQPSGDLLEYYGLAAAVWQCFYSTMEYLYTRKNQQNPIKICLLPFIFALSVLLFSLFKCRT
ncbi:hypothetical protein SADUNF_Sadunf06G0215600 [Salix dunnii]|uniref:Uncharacterized protein n=1 Tax=Salix dunnii TaxID=1413687 RepID=A0A835N3C8_9ROSI|nr:hypothetical protein SADUNF_Sadunf06G0215600 [Salix dunnii]